MSSYLEKHLMADEQIVYRTKLHWKIFWKAIAFVAAAAIYWIAVLATGPGGLWFFPAVLLLAAAVIFALPAGIRRWVTEFAVSNRRVLIRTGIIRRDSIEMLLEKVENIAVVQDFWDRLLNSGDITITGTGGGEQFFDDIADPLLLRTRVQEQVTQRLHAG